jgi:excisionase family DNA binding protein
MPNGHIRYKQGRAHLSRRQQLKTEPRRVVRPARPNSIAAAAETLGVSQKTIRNEIGRGRLRAVKLGKRILVFAEALEEYRQQLPAAHLKI